jgi:hypothetical protein
VRPRIRQQNITGSRTLQAAEHYRQQNTTGSRTLQAAARLPTAEHYLAFLQPSSSLSSVLLSTFPETNPINMAQLEIHVTGTGTATRRAERGILVLEAQSQQLPTAEEASVVVTSTVNKIREAIAPFCPQDDKTRGTKADAAIAHYSMSTLDTSSNRERRPSQNKNIDEAPKYDVTYSARAEFNIKFSNFAVLDKLATQFAAMDTVHIKHINWRLTNATLVSIEGGARKDAAQNALQRARNYAEVFADISEEDAARRVKAVDVKEDQYYQQSTKPQLHYGKKQRTYGTVVDKTELQFEPEDVRLDVKVTGKFIVEE